ncbi:hypothetical protein EDD85DRAFT_783253 [Armillaria nabsnona]|nr:hypothetical protein EDD85DRAFT_783253 [Armillaria nabsnona]
MSYVGSHCFRSYEWLSTLYKRLFLHTGASPRVSSIPALPIQKEGSSETLPASTDVVIVGSGITGTAFARTLLDADGSMEIVMLEARDACSGVTARNGGHITPPLYHDYLD